MKRLLKAGIDPQDLATIMWELIEPTVEAKLQGIVAAIVDQLLHNMTIVSKVQRR